MEKDEMKAENVVAFGDSTTAPREAVRTYPELLAERFPRCKFTNAGIPGNTTRMARERFGRDVTAHRPEIVVIQFGINDSTVDTWKQPPALESRVPLYEYEDNLRYFIRELRKIGCRPILMTPNPLCWTEKLKSMYGCAPYDPGEEDGFNVILVRYVAAVKSVAESEGVEFFDIYSAYRNYCGMHGLSLRDLLPDGMHPDNAGHRLVADLLMKTLNGILQKGEA